MTVETDKTRLIHDAEIREDIERTEFEIRAAEKTIALAEQGIAERRGFIAKLRLLLEERASLREDSAR